MTGLPHPARRSASRLPTRLPSAARRSASRLPTRLLSAARSLPGLALATLALLAIVGCRAPIPHAAPASASEGAAPDSAPATAEPAPQPASPDLFDSPSPTPLGFDDFSLSPAPPVRATGRFDARAHLMPGVSPYTDVRYVWTVDGRPIRNWSREFLRHAEGRWRHGDVVSVYARATDETGRSARTETLSVRLGEVAVAERPEPQPPIDWDALRAEDQRRAAQSAPRTRAPEPAPTQDPGRFGFYVNPVFNPGTDTIVVLPRPRRGITTGPEQRVDGYSPGEPRVNGYSPGEPRVDGYSPGEPRVGATN